MRTHLRACLLILLLHAAPGWTAEVPEPDPSALRLDWWLYFDTTVDERLQRLDALEQRIRSRAVTAAASAEVLNALSQYRSVLAQPAPAVEVEAARKDRYRLRDLYALAARIRELELGVQLAAEDEQFLQSRVDSLRDELDLARAAYQALEKGAATVLDQGLEVMRLRFELERLRLLAQARARALAGQKLGLKSAIAELSDARLLLHVERAELEALGKQLRHLQDASPRSASLEDLREDQLAANADGISRGSMLLLLGAQIAGSGAQLRIALNLAEYALVGYLLDPGQYPANSLRQQLAAVTDASAAIGRNTQRWSDYLAREELAQQREIAEAGGQASALPASLARRERLLREAVQALRGVQRDLGKVPVLSDISNAQLLLHEGWFRDSGKRLALQAVAVWDRLRDWGDYSLFELEATPVTPIGLLRVVFILVIAWWLSVLVGGALARVGARANNLNRASLYALRRLSHYLILFVGLLLGLSSIGVDFTKFALLASALGVGIGFGLQNFVQNFVAGLMILFERTLKVGDFVELESGVVGEVREINIRSTWIATNDNVDVLVPNSEFVNNRVTNWTLADEHIRVRIPFGVAYGTDKERVKRAALKAAELVPYTLAGEGYHPQVFMTDFGDSSLDFLLVVWVIPEAVRAPGKVRSAYLWELENQLREAGIEIPFPQRDLHVRSDFRQRPDLDDALGL